MTALDTITGRSRDNESKALLREWQRSSQAKRDADDMADTLQAAQSSDVAAWLLTGLIALLIGGMFLGFAVLLGARA